ncbi:type I cytoskeletal 18-like protein, putative [Babesia caballi]|uniref:Type I cytoskeletal 18-like protein, putative n=1 Tax=Babesia caballi TaxID=5871 RepID=A0AAV4LY66_BABCB|nr:type I cytoskeletal 18-like protein, putative [Babesia caballi]
MSGGIGSGIFNRLLSMWQSLRGETVKFVDAVTNPASPGESPKSGDGEKPADVSPAESFSTTDGTEGLSARDELASSTAGTNSPTSVDNDNEFIIMLEKDLSASEDSKQLLNVSCVKYRTDMPLDDLLQVSVGLHRNLEKRVECVVDTLSAHGVDVVAEKAELHETIPEAVHEGGAKEKAMALKRGRCRRSQRNMYPTPKLDESRPAKVTKKSQPTDLKQLELSKETRQLLELDSPLKVKKQE